METLNYYGHTFITADRLELWAKKDRQKEKERAEAMKYAQPYAAIKGVTIVYRYDNYDISTKADKFETTPLILYDGVIMRPLWLIEGTTELLPSYHIDYMLNDNPEIINLENNKPKRVGKPTAKKLQQWAEFGKKLIETVEKLKTK